jgi:hypothetical protein
MEWSYDSWTKKYGYYCEKAYLRTLGKASTLLVMTLVTLILLYLADKFGRKPIIIASCVLILSGIILPLLMPTLLSKMVSLGFAAGAEGAFGGLFTILINENTRKAIIDSSADDEDQEYYYIRLLLELWDWKHCDQCCDALREKSRLFDYVGEWACFCDCFAQLFQFL